MVRGIAGILPEFHSGDPAPVQTLAEVFSSRTAGGQRASDPIWSPSAAIVR